MKGLKCPKCGTDKHLPKYEIDGLYVCSTCGRVLGYTCDRCEKLYTENRLGRHGDVYECKLCGRIQWGYTEWKRGEGK